MKEIIIQLIFISINAAFGYWNYRLKNYKTAMLSACAIGWCLMAIVNSL